MNFTHRTGGGAGKKIKFDNLNSIFLTTSSFLGFLLLFCPGVTQGDGPIKDRSVRGGILGVQAEITEPFKLIQRTLPGFSQARFQHAIFKDFQGVWVDIDGKILAFFDIGRVFFNKKMFVQSHLRLYCMLS